MRLRPALLVFCLLALAPPAAADPIGVWVVDEAAWERDIARLTQRILGQMSPQDLQMMRAAGIDPASAIAQSLGGVMEGELELRADGTAIARDPEEPEAAIGRWERAGDAVVIRFPEDESAMVATVSDGRMTLRPDLSDLEPEERAIWEEFGIPLVPR
jgi:hypothetical protein